MIDSHTHLNDIQLYDDREKIIARAGEAGVSLMVNSADTISSIQQIYRLYKEFPQQLRSTYGVIPNSIKGVDLSLLEEAILKCGEGLVAIGEIGLDYHYENDENTKAEQKSYFLKQIELAKKYQLPIVVHSREADQDTFDILTSVSNKMKVYLHCYSGSAELARRYMEKIPDIFFGIGGVLTFKNARKLVEVVEEIPLSHLLLETDAPYLTPAPFRGKLNEPAHLVHIAASLARIKKVDLKDVEDQTTENAMRFFFNA